jgi:Ni2+-binding GTPase involved in maturation of urease and hydrogenase
MVSKTSNPSGPLPVTLISGFLGSGKTTLLQHILKNKDFKCAVIVNDMAEINIDASLVEKSMVMQKGEELVKFQKYAIGAIDFCENFIFILNCMSLQ